jgi:hypothetical protein
MRDVMEEKGIHSLGLCKMERRERVYFLLLCVEKGATT